MDDGGEADDDRGGDPRRAEEVGEREVGDVVGALEEAFRAGPPRVDDALRDALAGEVGDLLDEVVVLEEDGAAGADGEGLVVVPYRSAGVGGGEGAVVVAGGAELE